MWPTDDSTTKPPPSSAPMVRALAGDSTITRGFPVEREPVDLDGAAAGMVVDERGGFTTPVSTAAGAGPAPGDRDQRFHPGVPTPPGTDPSGRQASTAAGAGTLGSSTARTSSSAPKPSDLRLEKATAQIRITIPAPAMPSRAPVWCRRVITAGRIRSETRFMTLMRGLRAGPAVSLKGSPTVSPITAAVWASDPFPPSWPSSMYFLALSHAPPEFDRKLAMSCPVR